MPQIALFFNFLNEACPERAETPSNFSVFAFNGHTNFHTYKSAAPPPPPPPLPHT